MLGFGYLERWIIGRGTATMATGRDRRPSRFWYALGAVVVLLGVWAWMPLFAGMNSYGLIPEREEPALVARSGYGSSTSFDIQRAGDYSIFGPGWQDVKRTEPLRCEVTASGGGRVSLRPAPRMDIELDYDTYIVFWIASFTVQEPGRYTMVCNGFDRDLFEVRDEPTAPGRAYVARQRVGFWTGVLLGGAVVAFTAVRRYQRRPSIDQMYPRPDVDEG